MEQLKITCHLMSGFCANDPYSPSIDGIIAYAFRKASISDEQFAIDTAAYYSLPPVDGLPIQTEAFNGDWWYQSSFPVYKSQGIYSRYIHRRFNAFEAEALSPNTKKIDTTKGAFKNSRILLQQHITDRIEWHVIGSRLEIQDLLDSHITHIGKRVGAGFGKVRRWEISGDGDAQKARFFRALPYEFAQIHNISGDILQWGIRPPQKILGNQRKCVIPYARQ